jgi:hypothetical protein
LTVQFNAITDILRRATQYYGMYSRIARELGVSSNHVRMVAMGQRRSKRIERALAREIARIEKESSKAA